MIKKFQVIVRLRNYRYHGVTEKFHQWELFQ